MKSGIHQFLDQMNSLRRQFAFARFSLQTISKTKKLAFFKSDREGELAETEKALTQAPGAEALAEAAKQQGIDYASVVAGGVDALNWVRKKDTGPRNQRFHEELTADSLAQSELVLLMAYFEFFLKDFHTKLLEVDHKRVFMQKQKEVKFEKLFKTSYEDCLHELIIKEVKDTDKEKLSYRNEYFKKYFSFGFGNQEVVEKVVLFSELRNAICHQIMDATAIRIPKPEELEEARKVFRQVARSLWDNARKKYPGTFS